jgi:DNA-binding response OmpR family regulator
MTENRKILLVEDEESLGYLLSEYLKMKEFEVTWVKRGREALKCLREDYFDLVVLDVMMPEMDGFTLAREIRQEFEGTPFIFLTSRSLKVDVLKGFSLGAVDYLKKPIDEEELVVRLNTLLQTLSASKKEERSEKSSVMEIGQYAFHPDQQQLIHADGEVVQLTFRENKLMHLLASRKGELCTHKEILHSIWGKNDFFTRKSLNVFISHLRKYLKRDAAIKIENVHNQGFILRVE